MATKMALLGSAFGTAALCVSLFLACDNESLPSPMRLNPTATPPLRLELNSATDTPISIPTPSLIQLISEARKAVVQIETPNAKGSGFIFDKRGLVLTNAHVVGSFIRVNVVAEGLGLVERLGYTGDVIAIDEAVDLAVVSISSDGQYPHLEFGDSNEVSLGQEVIALGYPLSPILGESITATRSLSD